MGLGGALILLVGVAIAFANVVTTRRLWTSPIFETSQKVAQMALMWLIPGSAFVVWSVLREPRYGGDADATTRGSAFDMPDWVDGGGHRGGNGGDGGFDGDGGGGSP